MGTVSYKDVDSDDECLFIQGKTKRWEQYRQGVYKKNGGEREIRTLERLPVTRFPSVRLRPLGQLTVERAHHTIGVIRCQPCFHLTAGLIAVAGGRPIQYYETG